MDGQHADFLVVARAGAGAVALPRRLRLALAPGAGTLRVARAPPLDPAWRASVEAGWRAALALSGRADVDGELTVEGVAPLAGGSAGLSVGLLALRMLLEDGDAPAGAYATGHVLDPMGHLWGGEAARVKGEAAASLARGAGLPEAVLVTPPLAEAPAVPGLRVVMAADVGSAWGLLRPASYARIREAHRALRAAGAGVSGDLLSPSPDPRWSVLTVAEDGLVLWRAPVEADAPPERLARLAQAARRAALR